MCICFITKYVFVPKVMSSAAVTSDVSLGTGASLVNSATKYSKYDTSKMQLNKLLFKHLESDTEFTLK